jgi:hypothetical protein
MATWSSKRKFLYLGSIFIIILAIVFAVFFSIFYKEPTCSDRTMNGDEQGVDCGGSCIKLCQSAYLPAVISWGGAKFEKVSEGFYNVASYIVNPNTDAATINVPYKFSLFDNKGVLIVERKGSISLPAHRNVLAFESLLNTGKRIPAKATFEFLSSPAWFKSRDALSGIAITNKTYSEEKDSSSLQVTLVNRNVTPYTNVSVAAVLYDKDNNTIGFSKTILDYIAPNGGQAVAPFTWPINRNNKVISIEPLSSITPVLDR